MGRNKKVGILYKKGGQPFHFSVTSSTNIIFNFIKHNKANVKKYHNQGLPHGKNNSNGRLDIIFFQFLKYILCNSRVRDNHSLGTQWSGNSISVPRQRVIRVSNMGTMAISTIIWCRCVQL